MTLSPTHTVVVGARNALQEAKEIERTNKLLKRVDTGSLTKIFLQGQLSRRGAAKKSI